MASIQANDVPGCSSVVDLGAGEHQVRIKLGQFNNMIKTFEIPANIEQQLHGTKKKLLGSSLVSFPSRSKSTFEKGFEIQSFPNILFKLDLKRGTQQGAQTYFNTQNQCHVGGQSTVWETYISTFNLAMQNIFFFLGTNVMFRKLFNQEI